MPQIDEPLTYGVEAAQRISEVKGQIHQRIESGIEYRNTISKEGCSREREKSGNTRTTE